jgi:predicted membrane channel-forming protein YqfA (hemolysin III family)
MFELRDLFQWDRFITPSIIKIFYWLAVGMSVLLGLSGILSGLAMMFLNPFGGLLMVFGSLIAVLMGVIFARILAEYVLIMFRINEHLGAIRNTRGQM